MPLKPFAKEMPTNDKPFAKEMPTNDKTFQKWSKNAYRQIEKFLENRTFGLNHADKDTIVKICKFYQYNRIKDCPHNDGNFRVKLLAASLLFADTFHVFDSNSHIDDFKKYDFEIVEMPKELLFEWSKIRLSRAESPLTSNQQFTLRLFNPFIDIHSHSEVFRKKLESWLQDRFHEFTRVIIDHFFFKKGENGFEKYFKGELSSSIALKLIDNSNVEHNFLPIKLVNQLLVKGRASSGGFGLKVVEAVVSILKLPIEEKNWDLIKSFNNSLLSLAIRNRPCHVLLHKIKTLIDKHLRLKEEEVLLLPDCWKNLKKSLENLKRERDFDYKQLTKIAYSSLKGKKNILVFGFSNTFIDALKELIQKEKEVLNERISLQLTEEKYQKINIYIGECSNKNRFNYRGELEYSDGFEYAREIQKVADPEIIDKIHIIPDATISFFMKKTIQKENEEIINLNKTDAIVLGVNGIDIKKKEFGHTAGHLNIVELANKYNITLYILADTWKIGKLSPNQELKRGNSIIPPKKLEENQNDERIKMEIYNPREDFIRLKNYPHLICFLITNKGIFSIHDIPENIKSDFE